MARESFDKEIQFLRMLALTSGAYSRQQFADRLGISVHTFDKTMRRLKEIAETAGQLPKEEQSLPLAELLRTGYYESADPVLLFLFRSKSVKESESIRLSQIIIALQGIALTAAEVLQQCCDGMPEDMAMPDEKTIRSDLKYLEETGVIRKTQGSRPQRYTADNRFITELSDEELGDLYAFIDVMANTQIPSVQGYLLRDSLKKTLKQRAVAESSFFYKYHYPSRILDEAHLYPILKAIRDRKRLSFLYFTPKAQQSYGSKNTNPLFERESEGRQHTALPLRVTYDHQYGRWYMLCHSGRQGIVIYRMEGLTQLQESDAVEETEFEQKLQALQQKIRFSWLVDTGRTVKVKARFYNPEGSAANFVRDRVRLQGQWGMITEESDQTFIYEIAVNGTMEIKPWLRSFGSSCEVLEPRSLRQEFIEEWKELAAGYEPVRENL
ncbi:helix-turn-helix transcriptional regulator [Paenibacillus gorillae]|uniref:helix-turn-helix transcriptional regulator n=1 Tax=Paenibacillus gorillae TaxID=1243662 RepID=UPI0004B529C1|nr:WYL domain-containing protein [Paenibacillus gorillae]